MPNTFPENQWLALRTKMETAGAKAVIHHIHTFQNGQRIQLYHFARKAFAFRDWQNKNFDDHIAICGAGVSEMLNQNQTESANTLAYNLAADLAPCWPGDNQPRTAQHFQAGLKAATNCIAWREQLNKDAQSFAIAHWAKGIHHLALVQTAQATQAFEKAFLYATRHAETKNQPTTLTSDAPDDLLLAAGYNALGQWANNNPSGKQTYQTIISTFKEKHTLPNSNKDDIQFYIDQLEKVRGQFIRSN